MYRLKVYKILVYILAIMSIANSHQIGYTIITARGKPPSRTGQLEKAPRVKHQR